MGAEGPWRAKNRGRKALGPTRWPRRRGGGGGTRPRPRGATRRGQRPGAASAAVSPTEMGGDPACRGGHHRHGFFQEPDLTLPML